MQIRGPLALGGQPAAQGAPYEKSPHPPEEGWGLRSSQGRRPRMTAEPLPPQERNPNPTVPAHAPHQGREG